MIDGHNDLPWAMRTLCDYDFDVVHLNERQPRLHTDIGRLREGGVTGQFWSVFVPSTLPGGTAVSQTLEQIEFVYRLVERYPDDFALATSVAEVEAARSQKRIASLLGMEGGHSINESIGVLRMMYELGCRYMTLTHNDNTPWADSATDTPVLGGLNAFGKQVVREMNRLGMLVDLSHVSADVMRQAIAVSRRPVMFSHSSARAVCDVPRNVPDDVLVSLTVNGGLCMVTFVADFVSPKVSAWFGETRAVMVEAGGDPRNIPQVDKFLREYVVKNPPPKATIDDVIAHIEHVRDVAGVDHIGIGGDYDGCMFLPVGLEDVSGYPRLFSALSDRGWSAGDLDKLRANNVLRVLHDAEA